MHNKQRVHFLMWIYQLSITVLQQKQEKTLKGSYLFRKASSDAVKPYINVVAVNSKDKDNKTYKNYRTLSFKRSSKSIKEDTKDGEKPVDLSKKEIEEIENELAKII